MVTSKNLAMPLRTCKLRCYMTIVSCPAIRRPPEQVWWVMTKCATRPSLKRVFVFSRQGHTLSRKSYLYSSIDRVFGANARRVAVVTILLKVH